MTRRLSWVMGALACLALVGCGDDGSTPDGCPSGQTMCGDDTASCTNLNFDPDNCGACGNVCMAGEACATGTCVDSADCPGGSVDCGGTCTITNVDRNNCGGCGNVCAADEICNAGTCTPAGEGCIAPLTDCAGVCTNTTFDPSNCGACGNACGMDEVCSDSSCVGGGCAAGQLNCLGACVPVDRDPANCGDCGVVCGDGEVCDTGTCTDVGCTAPLEECDGSCTNTNFDPRNCGTCGTVCEAGMGCIGGECGTRPTVDEDGDTISDFDEQSDIPRDTDGDGTPDFRDLDSDGDGISDADEAGDDDVRTPPVDSDGDRTPDFQDDDSDNDGLLDSEEVTLGTDPTLLDTDGDGESDGVEIAGGSDPLDPDSTLASSGDFTFDLLPGGMDRTDTLQFNPSIQKADILFLVDTTGSMGGVITDLRTSLTALVSAIRDAIPDAQFGVARHDDFPVAGYGSGADRPYVLVQRITNNDMAVRTGVNSLTASGGADGPESQIEALYQAAVGDGFRSMTGTTWVPAFDPDAGFDADLGHGRIGGAGYREDAKPIVILATDITFHRKWGDTTVVAGDRFTWCGETATSGCDAYAMGNFGAAADQQPKTINQALTALRGIGAAVLGLAVRETGVSGRDARAETSSFAVRTGAWIDPDAAGNCQTGVDGADRPAESWDPDGAGPAAARDLCPLVFSADGAGDGTTEGIVNALNALTSFVPFSTLHTEARDNPATAAVDESEFFVRGIPVSADPATCDPLPTPADRLDGTGALGSDGEFDSFTGVVPGCLVTFQIVARNDDVVARTCRDQLFNLDVIVVGDDVVEADRRTVVVRVPGDRTVCP